MRVLVIMHTESEGPGTLGDYLAARRATVHTIRLHEGQRLPRDLRDVDAVISMGGPMNVYEEDRFPFLRDETEFLRDAVSAGAPILGICLGAQMIAKACRAPITQSPVKEVGWGCVSLTDAGLSDPLFRGVPRTLPVFQWHEDTFAVPAGGELLASSEACPHQAFRCRNAYGLQFHVEVTRSMLAHWFADSPMLTDILSQFERLRPDLAVHAETIYANFLSLVTGDHNRPA